MADDDLDEDDRDGTTVVRHIVKDFSAVARLRKIQAQADARERRDRHRAELGRLRLQMSSHEAASRHLARWAAFYLFASVLAFLSYLVVTDGGGDQTATVATLVTVVVTTIGGLLRSVVTERRIERAHTDDDDNNTSF